MVYLIICFWCCDSDVEVRFCEDLSMVFLGFNVYWLSEVNICWLYEENDYWLNEVNDYWLNEVNDYWLNEVNVY